jgi:DNA mismatch endonuclease (patch repair protein)
MKLQQRGNRKNAKPRPISESRARIMASIRGTGNETTELAMARVLRQSRMSGWRRHLPLPGRPDFAWARQRVALFVDGCFWHGCPKCYRAPKHNRAFWRTKIQGNRARDKRVSAALRRRGWVVLRVWECQVASPKVLSKLQRALTKPS